MINIKKYKFSLLLNKLSISSLTVFYLTLVKMKKTKYLLAYLLPALVLFSFLNEGWLTLLPLIIYFGILPLLELLIPPNDSNWNQEQLEKEKKSFFYDLVLFGMVPIQL